MTQYDFSFVGAWREDFPLFADLELKEKVKSSYDSVLAFCAKKPGVRKCVVRVEYKGKMYSLYYQKA